MSDSATACQQADLPRVRYGSECRADGRICLGSTRGSPSASVTDSRLDDHVWVRAQVLADHRELDEIEPALTLLVFRYERLRAAEPLCERRLRHASCLPRLDQEGDGLAVRIGVERGQQGSPAVEPAIQGNPKSDKPKLGYYGEPVSPRARQS